MTPQELRSTRLKSDFREMCNIRGPIISWQATSGTPPYVQSYRLIVNVRSIIAPDPVYREQHVIDVEIPSGYPLSPPHSTMVSDPVVFHPNWWTQGHWCWGTWEFSEGLGHYVIRMIRTLQYDPVITNEESPANCEAKEWYLEHRNDGLFPCDRQTLPDPGSNKFEIHPVLRKRFEIRP